MDPREIFGDEEYWAIVAREAMRQRAMIWDFFERVPWPHRLAAFLP